jgi:hypothetical protein
MVTVTCQQCGKSFGTYPRSLKKGYGKYCSMECKGKASRVSLEERFWKYTDKRGPDDCWEWSGGKSSNKYGELKLLNRSSIGAHVFSYMLHKGAIEPGMFIIHSCNNPGCVNPNHLRQGTQVDNMQDRIAAGRYLHGDQVPGSKLTWEKVREIRAKYIPIKISTRRLAREYGVSQTMIRVILNGTWWKEQNA